MVRTTGVARTAKAAAMKCQDVLQIISRHRVELGAVFRVKSLALFGSVAAKVVRKAACPVLSVRHPDQKFVMPE